MIECPGNQRVAGAFCCLGLGPDLLMPSKAEPSGGTMAKKPKETIIFRSSEDTVHDAPLFGEGDRVEFSVDYPALPDAELLARAGDAATVVRVAPTTSVVYEVKLASDPDAKWPLTVAGRYLVPEGSGIRGEQETKTVLVRHTGELRRF
jgi:hypothetical protein